MFYYLLYNSSFVNLQEKDYNIKLLIFGTISYIIVHSIIYSFKKLESVKNYFWLLLTLDITSVYFLINNKNNGKLNIISTSISQNKNNDITNNSNNSNNSNNINNNITDNEIKKELDNLKTKTTELEKTQTSKENIKLEIKDTLISNDKEKKNNIVKVSFDSDSDDHGSDLDIDLEAFEQSLN